ncbi:hypothetical protein HBB04_02489 [Pseudomonas coronafaciens]|nr:hypothetical protein HBB04_02489 [Pseudomonas coronafaciens]
MSDVPRYRAAFATDGNAFPSHTPTMRQLGEFSSTRLEHKESVMTAEFDVHHYCESLGDSHLMSDRVIGWTGRWSILGSFVICSTCLATQQVDNAHEQFEHLQGCVSTELYPWYDLQKVLSQIPLRTEEPHTRRDAVRRA